MLSKNILIAIFVAAYFRCSSQVMCKNDVEFKHAIMNAPKKIVIIIVTKQANHEMNMSISNFFREKKIQVNLNEGGDCSRTVQLLGFNTINTTEVRIMKGNYLVEEVRVVGYDPARLNEGFDIAKNRGLQSYSLRKEKKLSELVADWPEEPMPGAGPQEVGQGSSQPTPDTGPQASTRKFPFLLPDTTGPQASNWKFPFALPDTAGPQAATTPTFPFAIPGGSEAIPAVQSVGSSVTPGQRANLNAFQQTGATDLRSDSLGPVGSSWLSLGVPKSGPADDGSDDDPPTSTTPTTLRPKPKIQKPGAAGSSRGPR